MKTIDEDIKTGRFCGVYLLYGGERYLKMQYRDRLKAALAGGNASADNMNYTVFEGKEINQKAVVDLAETLPFFAERRVILIEDSGLFKGGGDELAGYLAQAAPTVSFLFVEDEVDKRSKLYKAVKKTGRIVEFATQSEELLTRWILSRLKKEGKNITKPVMQLFLRRTGTDMGNIDRELEKLFCYTMGKNVIEAADVEAITTEQTANRIFDMVNAIAGRDRRKALELYYDLLALKEPPMRIMYLITRQFQILLNVRDMAGKGFDSRTMAQTLGVPEFAVRRNITQAKGFSLATLEKVLEEGVELEEAVKTGRMDDRLSVELFLMRSTQRALVP